jgi:hypothetical protein
MRNGVTVVCVGEELETGDEQGPRLKAGAVEQAKISLKIP